MTQKHYVALAAALASVRPKMGGNSESEMERQWVACVRVIGDACLADNPRFDRIRFVQACMA